MQTLLSSRKTRDVCLFWVGWEAWSLCIHVWKQLYYTYNAYIVSVMRLLPLHTDDFDTCIDSYCRGGKSAATILPAGWGQTVAEDIASIMQSHELAKLVTCGCTKCSHYDEMKSWVAYDKGGCKVAADHTGLTPCPILTYPAFSVGSSPFLT